MEKAPAPSPPVSLFYSYAHEDEALRDELRGHLKILERRGLLSSWHDRQITPGEDWHARIDEQLRMADLVLLLVSKDFIDSDYIVGTELEVAMQRHAAGLATVVPIVVRAINVEPEDADALPFLKLQGLPTDLRPVTSWSNRDEAWTNVAKGLRATVKAIHEKKAATRGAGAKRGVGRTRAARRGGDGAAPADVRRADPLLDLVVEAFAGQVEAANAERGGGPIDGAALRTQALGLIDGPDQKRVLWVDDRPEGNRNEIAALAKLQIEVLAARSTDEAVRMLAEDKEGIDLIISDWERPGEGPGAGLGLLARLRVERPSLPVVFYHSVPGQAARAERTARAREAGALGEAVLPAELFTLVLQALRG